MPRISEDIISTSGNLTKKVIITQFSEHRPRVIVENLDLTETELNDFLYLRMFVYPTGKGLQNTNFVSLMILLITRRYSKIVLDCTVSIIDAFGCLRRPSSFGCNFFRGWGHQLEIGLERYVCRMGILSDSSGLLNNDRLTLQCEVTYKVELLQNSYISMPEWTITPLDNAIQDGQKTLVVETSDGASFSLLVEEGNWLDVGSDILHQVCDKINSSSDRLVLKNVSEVTLKLLFNYFKNAKFHVSTIEEAFKLFKISRTYNVIKLSRDCVAYIRDHLNMQNIAEMSLWAHVYGYERLEIDINSCSFYRILRKSINKKIYIVIVPILYDAVIKRIKESTSYSESIKCDANHGESSIGLKVDTLQKLTMDYVTTSLIFIKNRAELQCFFNFSNKYETDLLLPAFHNVFRQNLRNLEYIISGAVFEKYNGMVDDRATEILKNSEQYLNKNIDVFENQLSDEYESDKDRNRRELFDFYS